MRLWTRLLRGSAKAHAGRRAHGQATSSSMSSRSSSRPVSCRRIHRRNFGAIVDRANSAAQNELVALVPGAVHITDTHSGHNIMIDNAPVVIQAIRMVVDAVRAGQTRSRGDELTDNPRALN